MVPSADSQQTSSGPLSDIRILDIGHVLAGPFAATLLGDLGADVIKVENPRKPDTLRTISPKAGGVPIWWKVAGRNKRCITLDLKIPEGKETLLRLIDESDVLIENFRAGTLEKMGLAPEVLHQRNPRLIVLRISGFGQTPLGVGRPGFGRVGEAMSGTANLTGEAGGRPLHVGFSLGDATTGMMGALGVLAALHERDRSGLGEVIDIALFETLFRMIEWQIPMADVLGRIVRRAGNQFPIGYAVAGSFLTSDDRWVTISAATEHSIRRTLSIVGGPELADDPRFANFAARDQPGHLDLVEKTIREWIGARPAVDVEAAFDGTDVAFGFVYDAEMMLADELFAERETIVEIPDPQLGSLKMPGIVPKLQRNPGRVRWAGTEVGSHTSEVLGDVLGLSEAEIRGLAGVGALG